MRQALSPASATLCTTSLNKLVANSRAPKQHSAHEFLKAKSSGNLKVSMDLEKEIKEELKLEKEKTVEVS